MLEPLSGAGQTGLHGFWDVRPRVVVLWKGGPLLELLGLNSLLCIAVEPHGCPPNSRPEDVIDHLRLTDYQHSSEATAPNWKRVGFPLRMSYCLVETSLMLLLFDLLCRDYTPLWTWTPGASTAQQHFLFSFFEVDCNWDTGGNRPRGPSL